MADDANAVGAPTEPPLTVPQAGNVTSPPSVTRDATTLSGGVVSGEGRTTAEDPSFDSPGARAQREQGHVGDSRAPASEGSNSSSRPPPTTSRKKKKRSKTSGG